MKITFLTSTSHTSPYKENYSIIINYLTLRDHNVFTNFYDSIRKSDLVIAECSYPSINIGYEIAYALQHEKEVIILKSNDSDSQITNSDLPHSHKNAHIYTYNKYNILSTLKNALEYNSPKKYKKFNVLFSPTMIAKLNHISQKKNLPKSVYIRGLIEKSLALEEL